MEIHTKFKEFIDYLNSLQLKDRDLYEQYAMMKNATKVLDERVKELQGMIADVMLDLGVDKQEFDYGTFSIATRKTYRYSQALEQRENQLNEELENDKQKERESGVATCEEKKGLLFRS